MTRQSSPWCKKGKIKNPSHWSDETDIELFDLNSKSHAWRKPVPAQYHPNNEAWWWQHHAVGVLFGAGTGGLVRFEGKHNDKDEDNDP